MDGKAASDFVGLTYGQTNYFVKRLDGLITQKSESQGLPRDFIYRDLVMLRLARLLREDGYRLDAIKEAVSQVFAHWLDDNPENAGGLRVNKNSEFTWTSNRLTMTTKDEQQVIFYNYPKFFYDVRRIAIEVTNDIQ
jgi:DNA-binding transcriptional MerR regulator